MIYLDNAATSFPKPASVKRAVIDCLEKYSANPGRSGHTAAVSAALAVYGVREKTAEMFGASKAENVIFTLNATHALNIALHCAVKRDMTVITSTLEHNSVLRPLYKLQKERNAKIALIRPNHVNPAQTVKQFVEKLNKNCCAVVLTACSNVTGERLPLAKIGRLCREKGVIFIVDAAQAAGYYRINMREMCIDMLCIPSHKGLMGICGSGALIVSDSYADRLTPLLYGGSGAFSADADMPPDLPERIEAGTLPLAAILSMGAGIDYINQIGMEELCYRSSVCASAAREYLGNTAGITLYPTKGSIVLFNLEGKDSGETADLLDRCGIATRSGLHCAPLCHEMLGTLSVGAVRASFGPFNRRSDSAALCKSLRQAQSLP